MADMNDRISYKKQTPYPRLCQGLSLQKRRGMNCSMRSGWVNDLVVTKLMKVNIQHKCNILRMIVNQEFIQRLLQRASKLLSRMMVYVVVYIAAPR